MKHTLTFALLMGSTAAFAEAPKVVTDILPVHGLVARVMDGVAEPSFIVQPGASPHDDALRPSTARAVSEADLIVWVGEGLTPWLGEAVPTLAPETAAIELLEVPGATVLPFREAATMDPHGDDDHDDHDDDHDDHDDDHDDHDDHHDDHDDHGHEETAAKDDDHGHDDDDDHGHDEHEHEETAAKDDDHDHDHGHEETAAKDDDHDHDHGHDDHEDVAAKDDDHGDHDDHDDHGDHDDHDDHDDHAGHGHHHHGEFDPHAWLDPNNAIVWTQAIAVQLAVMDPENAATYAANAQAAVAEIAAASEALAEQIEALGHQDFIVYHDAYQYLEASMDLHVVAAIADGEASDPGPARVAEIRDLIAGGDVACVFSEPQYNADLVNALIEGSTASSAVLDPLGSAIEPGAGFYPALLASLGAAITSCVSDS